MEKDARSFEDGGRFRNKARAVVEYTDSLGPNGYGACGFNREGWVLVKKESVPCGGFSGVGGGLGSGLGRGGSNLFSVGGLG